MCQPGRPGPQGESQKGSPGLDAFHNAKSFLLFWPVNLAPKDPSPSSINAVLPFDHGSNLA